MSKRLTGLNPLAYLGIEPLMPPNMYMSTDSPTPTDVRGFNIGDFWVNTTTKTLYVLANQAGGVASWITTFGGATTSFMTNNGVAMDIGGVINLLGDTMATTTSGSGNTVTVALTQGNNGQLLIGANGAAANWANITSGDSTITITNGANSIDLRAELINVIGNGTNGQLLIGGGATPAWRNITAGSGISITNGSNSIQIAATGGSSGASTFHTNGSDATASANAITIAGDGAVTATSGSGSTVTVGFTSTTNGQIPIGATAGSVAWATLTAGSNINITNGPNSITIAASGAGGGGATTFITDTSGPASETGGDITMKGGHNITTDGSVSNTVTFNLSGTTNHAVQVGNSTGSLTSLTAATNGQVLIGSTGANPVFSTLTAGSGINITNGAGSVTIAATGGGGGSNTKVTTYGTPGSYTWSANAATKYVEVYGWSGGGGGGSGAPGNGGCGGGAGSFFRFRGPSEFFGSSAAVVVGTGGAGAAGVTSGTGLQGSPGTISSFGSIIPPVTASPSWGITGGNQGGAGGQTSPTLGGYSGGIFLDSMTSLVYFASSSTASENTIPTVGLGGYYSGTVGGDGAYGGGDGTRTFTFKYYSGTPGGAGGSVSGGTAYAGGAGGSIYALNGSTVLNAGGLAGVGGAAGGNGNDYVLSGGITFGGTGGGGGGGNSGKGGNGGFPGGGGGGGGGGVGTSGAGGNGGNGLVIVIEWM